MLNNLFVWNDSAVTSSILKKISNEKEHPLLYYANSAVVEFNDKISLLEFDGIKMLKELKEKQIEYVFSNSQANSNKLLDYCSYLGFKCIGAKYNDTFLESSKIYSKQLMNKYHIKTARYIVVENISQLKNAFNKIGLPCVIKADGLAKSLSAVVVTDKLNLYNISKKYLDGYFGNSSKKIILEEYIQGKEVSVPLILDGNSIKIFNTVRDYKRRDNNDFGSNTGGMGSVVPFYLNKNETLLLENLIEKLCILLKNENHFYKGFMTLNVIFTKSDVYLLEINTRLGDSEGQTILSLLDTDLSYVFEKMYCGCINELKLDFKVGYSMSINIINSFYPDIRTNELAYIAEKSIIEILKSNIDLFFYKYVNLSNGNYTQIYDRFISITSNGKSIKELKEKLYSNLEKIDGKNIFYRSDIGDDIIGKNNEYNCYY